SLGEGLGIVDLKEQRFVYVDETFEQIYGQSAEELIALPSYYDTLAAGYRELLPVDSGRGDPLMATSVETVIVRRDGVQVDIEYAVRPAPEFGQDRAVVLVRDITARKRTEQASRFGAYLLDQVDVAVIACDAEGRVTSWNTVAEQLFGWERTDAIGRPVEEVCRATEPDSRLAKAIATGSHH